MRRLRIGVTLPPIVILLALVVACADRAQAKPQQIRSGCRYEGRHYEEGESVITAEPCLQCQCVKGSLRCRLRICPRLPQPSPPGCRARPPGEHACCPELVCGSDEEEGCLYEGVRYGPGSAMMGSRRCEYCYCISGARRCIRPKCLLPLPGCAPLYAPESCCPVAYNCTRQADFSTTLAAISGNGCRTGEQVYQEGEMVRDIEWKAVCDNCFCAMGVIRCVPLACAPPLQGCKPIVREGQCCPSTYNCSGTIEVKAAQNFASYAFISKDYAKFRKETNFYPAIHDSALGASGVEGRGHRVVNEALESLGSASSSGSAGSTAPEIVAEKFPMATESMPQALETETMNNEIPAETTSDYPAKPTARDQEPLTATSIEYTTMTEAVGFEQTVTTHEPTSSSISTSPAELTSTLLPDIISTTLEDSPTTELTTNETTSGETSSTGLPEDEATATSVSAITQPPESSSSITSGSLLSSELADNSASRRQEPGSTPIYVGDVSNKTTTVSVVKKTEITDAPNATTTTTLSTSTSTEIPSSTSSKSASTSTSTTIASTTISTSTQAQTAPDKPTKSQTKEESTSPKPSKQQDEAESTEERTRPMPVKKPSSGLLTSILVPDDMLVMNVTVKTNVAVGHLHGVTINPMTKPMRPDLAAILNITNRAKGEDYDYDYSSPTLPPSLPNVRIIPFVAADALVKDKGDDEVPPAVTGYPASAAAVPPPDLAPTDAAKFYDIVTQENRFSPPEKTEGGFMPREPPYFDPLFHASNLNLEIGTGVTVAPETLPVPNPHRKNDIIPNNCLYEEHEYGHGHVLPSRALCVTCICYYGEIVCSNQKCPPLKVGCQRVNNPSDKCCSKIICPDGVESPTVVLDRVDATSASEHEPTVSPDPFRDVIKTEPAPDLPSLIGDIMIPYLVEHTSPPTRYDAEAGFFVGSGNASYKGATAAPTKQQAQLSAEDVRLTSEPPAADKPEDDEASSIFSLDSVLELFFSEPAANASTTGPSPPPPASTATLLEDDAETTSITTPRPTSTTTTLSASTSSTAVSIAPGNSSLAPDTTSPTTTTTTTSRMEETGDKEAATTGGAGGGLLKVAGCNIYGRMYGVGRIIAELSTACLECRCTDVGVQCRTLADC